MMSAWVRSGDRSASAQCPLYSQKRTLELGRVMSALCQKRTLAEWPKSPTRSDGAGGSPMRLGWAEYLLHTIACELFGYVGLDCLGGGDVGVAAHTVTFFIFRQTAAIKRGRPLRINLERCVVIGDRFVEFAGLEIGEAATIECVGIVRPEPQRFVAILDGWL